MAVNSKWRWSLAARMEESCVHSSLSFSSLTLTFVERLLLFQFFLAAVFQTTGEEAKRWKTCGYGCFSALYFPIFNISPKRKSQTKGHNVIRIQVHRLRIISRFSAEKAQLHCKQWAVYFPASRAPCLLKMMDASNFFNMATLQITFTVSPAAVAPPSSPCSWRLQPLF